MIKSVIMDSAMLFENSYFTLFHAKKNNSEIRGNMFNAQNP
jgi:hypothetical protein